MGTITNKDCEATVWIFSYGPKAEQGDFGIDCPLLKGADIQLLFLKGIFMAVHYRNGKA